MRMMRGKWYTLASLRDIWDISMLGRTKKERVGYPTQKPLELLERVITASCPEDGIVLDAFCGGGTTCVAAERLGRRWVGVDVCEKAFDLVQERMKKEVAVGLGCLPNQPACSHGFGGRDACRNMFISYQTRSIRGNLRLASL